MQSIGRTARHPLELKSCLSDVFSRSYGENNNVMDRCVAVCCLLLQCQNLVDVMPDGDVWTVQMCVRMSVEAICC
jgi:hypothetical protein